ncbi:MAG: YceI family protein [Flavobacteriales bacterium]
MKTTIKSIVLTLALALVTFSFTTLVNGNKTVKVDKSKVEWKGYKVTGSHAGTISLKTGSLDFKEGKLTDGSFVIDMTSINNTDMEGEYKGKLEGHLKSDDFFGVSKFPTATMDFTKVKSSGKNAYDVTADLTIKGKTNKVNFVMSVYGNKATASLKIDRTKYDVQYGSTSFFEGLKDKAIYDEFDLVVDLEF